MINRKFLFLLMVPVFILALVTSSCDSGGGESGGSSVQKEGVTIEGALSEVVVAKAETGNKSALLAFFNNILKITKIARAQEKILEGITVEAFDPATDPNMENPIAIDTTDANGEFTLENVPCNTPLKLVFTFEGVTVTIGDGIVAPCPEGEETGVITMTFSINFGNGSGILEDFDEQTAVSGSQVSCIGGEQEQMIDDEFFVDGGGGACIVATGNCELEIVASSVKLINCISCIDTRGNADVEIQTTDFECHAVEDGIRSVGASTVEIDVILGDMMDGTEVPTKMQALFQLVKDGTIVGTGNGNILIVAEEDGVDIRGNTKVKLEAVPSEEGDDDDDAEGDDDDSSGGETPILAKEGETSKITIAGGDNGIIAIGNSEAEVKALSCDITPGTTSQGNAEIEVDCGQSAVEE